MFNDDQVISRRRLLLASGATLGLATLGSANQEKPPQPPPLPTELVRAFVGAGHGDLDKVKAMLAENPTLLNATYDWKNGDFESAIGGAGHMGRADIADYLIGQGARADIFVYTMLGDQPIVEAMLKRNPTLITSKGPHGISLLRHAEMGKEKAAGLLAWLVKQGAKD